jgi:ribosome-associated protein
VAEDVQGDLGVRPGLVIPAEQLVWRFSRGSGPGGQGVNTTDSRVQLRWDAAGSGLLDAAALRRLAPHLSDGVLTVTAAEHRSQWQNRRAARLRLAALVGEAVRAPGPRRRPTRPSRAAVERRLDAKRRRAELKRQRAVLD